jgi:hypothetical protein
MVGFNINQVNGSGTPAENTTLGGAGVNLSVVNETSSAMRIQIQSAPNADGSINTWCVEVEGSGGFYPWNRFNTACWAPAEGVIYNGEPVNVVAITVSGHNVDDLPFAFCLNKITPSADVCVGPPSAPPGEGGPGSGMPGDGTGVIGVGDGLMGDGLPGAGNGAPGAGMGTPGGTGDGVNTDPNGLMPSGAPGSTKSSSGCSLETDRRGSSNGELALAAGLLIAAGALSRRRMRSAARAR